MMLFEMRRAKQQAVEILASPIITTESISQLRSALQNGRVNGRTQNECFFGILGRCVGSNYQLLRGRFGVCDDDCATGVPVESLFLHIRPGATPRTNRRARMVFNLCNAELERRKNVELKAETAHQLEDHEYEFSTFGNC